MALATFFASCVTNRTQQTIDHYRTYNVGKYGLNMPFQLCVSRKANDNLLKERVQLEREGKYIDNITLEKILFRNFE